MEQGFKKIEGVISDLKKLEDHSFLFSNLVDGEVAFQVRVPNTAVVFDTEGVHVFLEEGKVFQAFIAVNKPMILIAPPQYTPDIIVVESEQLSFVKVDTFDDNYVSSDGRLRLHVDPTTVIVDLRSDEASAENWIHRHVAVFYSASTRSIPAQTSPKKIILLDD